MKKKQNRNVVAFQDWLRHQSHRQPVDRSIAREAARELSTAPDELESLARSEHPRVGLDLGHHETRLVFPDAASGRMRIVLCPTCIGYASTDDPTLRLSSVGKQALLRRNSLEIANPMRSADPENESIWSDYAEHFRRYLRDSSPKRGWGVIPCASWASHAEKTAKRAIGNELFDRVSLVDPAFLAALSLYDGPAIAQTLIVDIGATGIRATRLDATRPTPENTVTVDFGGDQVDHEIRLSLSLRYPELLLSEVTLREIKERFAFVSPAQRRSILSVQLGQASRRLDVTEIVRRSCELLSKNVLKATREVLSRCPSEHAEELQQNVVLVGGGAELRGLAARTQRDLRRDGYELATVTHPANALYLAAKGAYSWAQRLAPDAWNIPLFSFGA